MVVVLVCCNLCRHCLLGNVCVVCFLVLVAVMRSPGGHIGPGVCVVRSDGPCPSFLVFLPVVFSPAGQLLVCDLLVCMSFLSLAILMYNLGCF